MVSDSITPNASIPYASKDFGKKRRANRSAKLKQCKLDARREQWLSQVAVMNNKGGSKEDSASHSETVSPSDFHRKNDIENLETTRPKDGGLEEEKENGSIYHDYSDSASHSPTGSSVLSGNSVATNFSASSSSSSSSSSGGCCSGNITEEEGDDNCLDDWEAVADALAANDDNKQESKNDSPCLESESEFSPHIEPSIRTSSNNSVSSEDLKPPRLTHGNSRAWRSDDAFRPQSLPNLLKQRSFPNADRRYGEGGLHEDRHYGEGGLPWTRSNVVNVPSSCPICCEELDGTDVSFLPCKCGYRLCLFCYDRILKGDGRCPGCRKNYEGNPQEAELSVSGGSLTFRFSRSYSMVARA